MNSGEDIECSKNINAAVSYSKDFPPATDFLYSPWLAGRKEGFFSVPPYEAFYMTLITISTVGFSEIKPLSDVGRGITIIIIILGISLLTYTLGQVARIFVEGELRNSDADNVFIALSAKGLRPDIFILARASDVRNESKLLRAGASRVVCPYQMGGEKNGRDTPEADGGRFS